VPEKYEFLSDEWIEAARRIRDEADAGTGAPPHLVKMNLVITDAPDSAGLEDGTFRGHMDTSEGELRMDKGHLDAPDLTVTVDYETAKAIFVEQNPQAGMQAFMSGKVNVVGDITKLMAMQATPPDPEAQAIATKIKDLTV
jgi:putative sterol carrier protein